MSLSFWVFGLIGAGLCQQDIYFPIALSTAIFLFAFGGLALQYFRKSAGPLTLLLFFVYAWPFVHIVPYIWFDFDREAPEYMWGMVANPYMLSKPIVELTAMLGAIGALGFVAGTSSVVGLLPRARAPADATGRHQDATVVLSLPAFVVWSFVGVVLSWLSAPAETVFEARYTESVSLSAGWNANFLWMLSYAILLFTLADAMFDVDTARQTTKRRVFIASTLVVVVWLQLLRGDRESLPFVFAALLMYYVWSGRLLGHAVRLNWPLLAAIALAVFALSHVVGAVRGSMTGVRNVREAANVVVDREERGIVGANNALAGTWSAALLTPLSVAGDYINGTLQFDHGQTYVDLLASTIPGFVADWIGYQRPIDATRGPAWQMRYGLGGTHAVVVPFMAFGASGVFAVLAIWGLAAGLAERRALRTASVPSMTFLGVVATIAPHWLWYGEKAIINALALWFMLSLVYKYK